MTGRQPLAAIVPAIAAILLIATAFGCGSMRHEPEPIEYYVLHYPPPEPPPASEKISEKPAAIHVTRLQARPPYHANRIIYAESPYKRSEYVYHQWMQAPAEMLTGLLIRDIETMGPADAIASDFSGNDATHRIKGLIVDFYESNETEKWAAVLALRLSFKRIDPETGAGITLHRKTYRETRTLEKNNPHELARSMSEAMRAVSERFMADISPLLIK